jgi:glycerol-3-phosphate dehydrogenase
MLSAITRPKVKQFMGDYQFDVLVIGGGITGAGIALDAVTRGLSVALVEMQDFAAGTSSRSTKLVHGGLRYLKQLEVKIIAETGRERDIVYQNALHVTVPERMLLPFHKGGTYGKYTTSAGLFAYDVLAGVKKDERREMLTAQETLEMEPLLRRDGLLGGGHYVEYRTDDARLTIETMKKAVEKGALCLNYVKAEDFIYNEGKVTGAIVKDMVDGESFRIHASTIVNATGPWVDDVRGKDELSNSKRIRLTKGVHIVIDRSVFPLRQAIYFDAEDRRMIFAIPRGDKAYIGTTDTFFDGDLASPLATEEDINYLLGTIRQMFPTTVVARQDVESTWAGVRPLIYEDGKDPSEISRKDEIWEAGSGLITIAGGKLTGYRKMAETVVDLVVKRLQHNSASPCVTEDLSLSGGDFGGIEKFELFIDSKMNEAELYGLTKEEGKRLARFYGTNVDAIFTYAHALSTQDSSLPIALRAEIFYSIHHEMVLSPSDFFIRRKGDLYFNIQFVEMYKVMVTNYMAKLLAYRPAEKIRHLHELDCHIAKAKVKDGVSE